MGGTSRPREAGSFRSPVWGTEVPGRSVPVVPSVRGGIDRAPNSGSAGSLVPLLRRCKGLAPIHRSPLSKFLGLVPCPIPRQSFSEIWKIQRNGKQNRRSPSSAHQHTVCWVRLRACPGLGRRRATKGEVLVAMALEAEARWTIPSGHSANHVQSCASPSRGARGALDAGHTPSTTEEHKAGPCRPAGQPCWASVRRQQ